MDPLPNVPTLQVLARLGKGKGKKATIPSFEAQSPVYPESVYKYARDVAYFERDEKRKKNGKRSGKRSVEVTLEVEVE